MRILFASAGFLAVTTVAAIGFASERCQPATLLSSCIDADNLWLHAGNGWLSQAPNRALALGAVDTALGATYLLQPVGLRRASADPEKTTSYAVEHRLGATLAVAFGLGRGLELEAALPFVAYQRGAGTSDLLGDDTTLAMAALGDIRLTSHYHWPLRSPWRLSTRLAVAFPTGDDHAFSSAPGVVFAPAQNIARSWGRWHAGADLGLRLKGHTQLANTLLGSQLSISLAGGVDLLDNDRLRLDVEAFGLLGLLAQTGQERDAAGKLTEFDSPHVHWPAEWLVSVRTAGWLPQNLGARLGVGSFIPTGPSSVTTPLLRAVFRVEYRFAAAPSTK